MSRTFYIKSLGYVDLELVYASGTVADDMVNIFVRNHDTLAIVYDFGNFTKPEAKTLWESINDYHSMMREIELQKEAI